MWSQPIGGCAFLQVAVTHWSPPLPIPRGHWWGCNWPNTLRSCGFGPTLVPFQSFQGIRAFVTSVTRGIRPLAGHFSRRSAFLPEGATVEVSTVSAQASASPANYQASTPQAISNALPAWTLHSRTRIRGRRILARDCLLVPIGVTHIPSPIRLHPRGLSRTGVETCRAQKHAGRAPQPTPPPSL